MMNPLFEIIDTLKVRFNNKYVYCYPPLLVSLSSFFYLFSLGVFSFRHKNTPLDNHIQRGKTVQPIYKRYNFILNLQLLLSKNNVI